MTKLTALAAVLGRWLLSEDCIIEETGVDAEFTPSALLLLPASADF